MLLVKIFAEVPEVPEVPEVLEALEALEAFGVIRRKFLYGATCARIFAYCPARI